MDEELKNYLNDKFAEVDARARERMEAHVELEALSRNNLNSKIIIVERTVYGNDSDGTPGLVKKVDRIETGISMVKYVASGIGVISGVFGSMIHKLFR